MPTSTAALGDNGVFEPSQINWAIPDFSYQDILGRAESLPPGLPAHTNRPSDLPPQWRDDRGPPFVVFAGA